MNPSTRAATPVMVVDTTVPAPGGATFTGFDAPTFTSFAATWTGGGTGALRFTGTPSAYEVVATNTTAIPGGTGSFTGFHSPDQSLGHATGVNQEGIYRLNNAPNVAKMFDRNTPIPEGVGNFTSFGQHPVAAQNGAFYGQGSGGQQGVYGYLNFSPANITVHADRNTMFPGSAEAFTQLTEPTNSAFGFDGILFIGRSATRRGVFRANSGPGGGATLLFDTNTSVPNGLPGETFTDFGEAVGQLGVVIVGQSAARTGVYRLNGQISPGDARIADTNTLIPGGSGVFTSFDSLNTYGGNLGGGLPVVVLMGYGTAGQKGIYGSDIFGPGGAAIGEIISVGDTLDGKIITDLAMTNQSLSSYTLLFRANFVDGSSGIYRVQVPEPSAASLLFGLASVLLRRRGAALIP